MRDLTILEIRVDAAMGLLPHLLANPTLIPSCSTMGLHERAAREAVAYADSVILAVLSTRCGWEGEVEIEKGVGRGPGL